MPLRSGLDPRLITVVRYAEGMCSALATDLQAGSRQGDFHYAHEEMAMAISATLGAMNLLVEDGEVEHADRIAAEIVLRAMGVAGEG